LSIQYLPEGNPISQFDGLEDANRQQTDLRLFVDGRSASDSRIEDDPNFFGLLGGSNDGSQRKLPV
jgi:hypothetical protein